jgi:hypothetical protein
MVGCNEIAGYVKYSWNFAVVEQLVTSQEGLSSKELVSL